MTGELPASSLPLGTRVSFPYGGGRRVGTVTDVSLMPDQSGGGSTLSYLVDIGSRRVFVQGDSVVAAGEGAPVVEVEAAPPPRRRSGGRRRR